MNPFARLPIAVLAVLLLATPATGISDELPFAEGDVVGFSQVDSLEPWLPSELFEARRFLFYEGMRMEIGPARRSYTPSSVYRMASERYAGHAKIGPAGSLEDYVAGQPFAPSTIECGQDPNAGAKHAWNFVHRWNGFGTTAHFRFTYVDAKGGAPLFYQGRIWAYELKHRPEPRYEGSKGDVFAGERRAETVAFEISQPRPAKGTRTLTYRYESSYGPPESARPEDTWTFGPKSKRVRRISEGELSRSVGGSAFEFDEIHSFSGLPARFVWSCVEERPVLAPMNTSKQGFPYVEAADYGPSRLSYASDRWELRDAIHLRLRPKNPEDHPYGRKELWIDRETYEPLYSFAYDRKDRLWKVTVHNHRWSEDDLGSVAARSWYPSWESVSEPRDLRIVSEAVVDVQSGTGNRWDFWDAHGAPPPPAELMRRIDINSLKPNRWWPAL